MDGYCWRVAAQFSPDPDGSANRGATRRIIRSTPASSTRPDLNSRVLALCVRTSGFAPCKGQSIPYVHGSQDVAGTRWDGTSGPAILCVHSDRCVAIPGDIKRGDRPLYPSRNGRDLDRAAEDRRLAPGRDTGLRGVASARPHPGRGNGEDPRRLLRPRAHGRDRARSRSRHHRLSARDRRVGRRRIGVSFTSA